MNAELILQPALALMLWTFVIWFRLYFVRIRVMPARKVRLAAGVKTTPSLTMKMFDAPVSATLPSMSRTSALSKPRRLASTRMRALLG